MKILREFKAFAVKGNVVDLAVAVVIGAAFGKIVSALVSGLLMPVVGLFQGETGGDWRTWKVPSEGKIQFGVGEILGATVDFVIVAFVIFLVVVKLMALINRKDAKKEAAPPTTKECPQCLEQIAIKARKCKFCTSDQPSAT